MINANDKPLSYQDREAWPEEKKAALEAWLSAVLAARKARRAVWRWETIDAAQDDRAMAAWLACVSERDTLLKSLLSEQ